MKWVKTGSNRIESEFHVICKNQAMRDGEMAWVYRLFPKGGGMGYQPPIAEAMDLETCKRAAQNAPRRGK